MDNRYYTEDELNEMSIFRLRECARKIGVASPTNKRKQEIIDMYLGIAKGAVKPTPKNRRGRPPKNDSGVSPVKILEDTTVVVNEEDRLYSGYPTHSGMPSQAYGRDRNDRFKQPQFRLDSASIEEMIANGECEHKSGLLDIHPDGYGFLRAENCEYGTRDAYVPGKLIKSLGMRAGDMVEAVARKNPESNKPPAILSVERVNGQAPDNLRARPSFDNLVPIYPDERIQLELRAGRSDFAIRCIDLIAPIGKGQRAMIVSPPKAGKTTLLKKIASSIEQNYPEIELFVLLVDERPEEVTDMKRSIKGEVIYSTFDEAPEHHCKAAELLVERAKRSVELGKDVVIIMDSLTRLARAYNLTIPPTGRTLSGGMDPGALHSPKRFFGSARNIEHGGSLTIIATALVDTGSRMDDVIYEEFKGTGNMEIHLDRKLSERRIFPAIDLNRSSTRREDLLLSQKELEGVWAMRRMLSSGDSQEMTEQLLNMVVRTKSNAEFVDNLCMQIKAMEKGVYAFRKPN